ncbi:hypothetical protein RRG55_04345 [Mycoplasmopsis felis]|uniref:hypothetical protein n=1 Tax=Mycoplasmopsis felis TaxID=33923 RepID=UPI002AFF19AF|nr:hypothetical protein [Mycoplasmopsis felis]WQQ04278.1 hypothetical protein RRG47_01765 [Mycoplasmopsis felis]
MYSFSSFSLISFLTYLKVIEILVEIKEENDKRTKILFINFFFIITPYIKIIYFCEKVIMN